MEGRHRSGDEVSVDTLDLGAEVDAVVRLGTRSLGWVGDERDRAFLRWKHLDNPFGASPAWGARSGGELVAFRTLLRWRLSRGEQDRSLVRAVDTATDPEHQGRGLFRRLTLEAVDHLTAAGVDAVFNTPNDQSRPGYLKMGWQQLGRPTLLVHATSPGGLVRMLRARVPAELWSEDVDVGQPASAVAEVARRPAGPVWATPRTPELLRWRYGFEPLHYRAVEVKGGHAIFRVRRRGPLREVAIVDWLSEEPDPRAVVRLVRACGDYAVALGLTSRHGFVPVPRQGPIVTWRPLADPVVPALGDLGFVLGDIELF